MTSTASSIAVVTNGGDPTADLLARRARDRGAVVEFVDLRRTPLSLVVGPAGATVRVGRTPLAPDLVVNRTPTNGLGTSGRDDLARQTSADWTRKMIGAREDQGVALAAFETWNLAGTTVANRPEASDLALMPNAVTERLARRNVGVNRQGALTTVDQRFVVAGDKILGDGAPESTVRAVADEAALTLGEVWARPLAGDRWVVRGWNHQPDLTTGDDPERMADQVLTALADLPEADPGESGGFFFVPDLDRN